MGPDLSPYSKTNSKGIKDQMSELTIKGQSLAVTFGLRLVCTQAVKNWAS
jgi:hypothetical protein